MILKKREIANYGPDDVKRHLVDALNLVTELDPPTDLREVCFTKAVDLLSGKQILVEQMAATPNGLRLP